MRTFRFERRRRASPPRGLLGAAREAGRTGEISGRRPERANSARAFRDNLFSWKPGCALEYPNHGPRHFLGRDDALEAIDAALNRDAGRVAITALHGLRGVGKTTLRRPTPSAGAPTIAPPGG